MCFSGELQTKYYSIYSHTLSRLFLLLLLQLLIYYFAFLLISIFSVSHSDCVCVCLSLKFILIYAHRCFVLHSVISRLQRTARRCFSVLIFGCEFGFSRFSFISQTLSSGTYVRTCTWQTLDCVTSSHRVEYICFALEIKVITHRPSTPDTQWNTLVKVLHGEVGPKKNTDEYALYEQKVSSVFFFDFFPSSRDVCVGMNVLYAHCVE